MNPPAKPEPRAERVSLFFARGYTAAIRGQPASSLNNAGHENQWQLDEMHAGHAAYADGYGKKRHLQVWMVDGPYIHTPHGPAPAITR